MDSQGLMIPSHINKKKSTLTQITAKLQKTKDKENLQMSQRKKNTDDLQMNHPPSRQHSATTRNTETVETVSSVC